MVKINDRFWQGYRNLLKNNILPYQWDALNDRIPDAEKSYAIQNMRIAAGVEEGSYNGLVFQDSDLYKWLEAVGHYLGYENDPEMEKNADYVIDLMEKAQREDGYLNTYFILNGLERRFTNLTDCHELYCLGHMIEAAVAYQKSTGKTKLTEISCRYADLTAKTFGRSEGQLRGYPGHQVLELALVKLYDLTGEKRYLDLAEYFINERGQKPSYFLQEWEMREKVGFWDKGEKGRPILEYTQTHLPVREQKTAVGHAVRAVYMYTGMARVAEKTGDKTLLDACRILFRNITEKQMYITGGIGQTRSNEGFTFDYDLPADTVYSETCASIGLIFFAKAMLEAEHSSVYADIMELALYNSVISGVELDGKHFFYVNPLEVWPEASRKNPTRTHVKPLRQKWFGCSCCPPNIARLIASLGNYIYHQSGERIFVDLYIGSDAKFSVNGTDITISQDSGFPWDGKVKITVSADTPVSAEIALRIPNWCEKPCVYLNGKQLPCANVIDGYLYIKGVWQNEELLAEMPMKTRLMRANNEVRAAAGKVAVTRGPLVYCLEERDNGRNLSAISIPAKNDFTSEMVNDPVLGEFIEIRAKGFRNSEENYKLYYEYHSPKKAEVQLRFIPYPLWCNRGENEMIVWIRAAE